MGFVYFFTQQKENSYMPKTGNGEKTTTLGFKLSNFVENFNNTNDKIVLNDLNTNSKLDTERLKRIAMTEYEKDKDTIDNIPTCVCTETRGKDSLGVKCPSCDTTVQHSYHRPIEPNLWIRVPEGIAGFFIPKVYAFFSNRLTFSRWNGFEWLLKSRYSDPNDDNTKAKKFIRTCQALGLERGYHNVTANLDRFIEVVLSEGITSTRRVEDTDFIEEARGNMLTPLLPVPNKVMLILSNTSTGIYTDNTLRPAMEAILAATNLSQNEGEMRKIADKCAVISAQFNLYYDKALGGPFKKKGGLLRGVMFGGRSNFSIRTVISSEHGVHDYEEIKVPYSEFVVTFEIHLLNLLMNQYGYHPKKARRLIDKYTIMQHPFMHKLIKDLIASTENGEGFWSRMTRYPSMNINSTSSARIVGVTDKNATTISVLRLVAPNADFDGDQMTITVAVDKQTREMFKRRRPHFAIHSMSDYRQFNNHMKLPDTTVSSIHNWIERSDIECGLYNPSTHEAIN